MLYGSLAYLTISEGPMKILECLWIISFAANMSKGVGWTLPSLTLEKR